MSTIEETEYWKSRRRVREDILAVRNELLDIVAKKSVIERRLEQMQSELNTLNQSLLNEAYYLRLGQTRYGAGENRIYEAALFVSRELVPYGAYRDDTSEQDPQIQLFGQVRTVDGMRRAAGPADAGPEAAHRTGRYLTDAAGKVRYQLYDDVLATLLLDDPAAFRRISHKDPEGQVLVKGEFGIVPSLHEAVSGKIYVDENEFYEALARYYGSMAKRAALKSQGQHTAA